MFNLIGQKDQEGTKVRNVHIGKENVQKLKKYILMHCKKCGQASHNSATCKYVSDSGIAGPSHSTGMKCVVTKSATGLPHNLIEVILGITSPESGFT